MAELLAADDCNVTPRVVTGNLPLLIVTWCDVFTFMDLKALIGGLGGNQAVAKVVGVTPSAVANWVSRGAIAAEHHLVVWQMALRANLAWEPPGASQLRELLEAQHHAADGSVAASASRATPDELDAEEMAYDTAEVLAMRRRA